jgi:pyrroloquinoline-quinone synthase
MTDVDRFLHELDGAIDQNKMLRHPFYQTWTMGKLSRDALRGYAKQYHHFVQAFPTYLSATHANTPDLGTRQVLLENLIEEERGPDNHPDLWMRFSRSLGVSGEEAARADLLPETREALDTMRSLTRDSSALEGVAALYAYESQIPEVAGVKIDGLKQFYGITDPEALSFFTVHREADVYHSQSEREILAAHALDPADRRACVEAARRSAGAMLKLLDGVERAFVRTPGPVQTAP